MTALTAGALAPKFSLTTVAGERIGLADALQKGPVVLAFFKVSCPVCRYAFPFFERMYKSHHDAKVSFLGISQNDARDTLLFMKQFGVTFPVVLDDPRKYPVSNAYGLTNVPTLFYISANGEIEVSAVGWSKAAVEEVNQKLAALRQQSPVQLWRKGESVTEHRAG